MASEVGGGYWVLRMYRVSSQVLPLLYTLSSLSCSPLELAGKLGLLGSHRAPISIITEPVHVHCPQALLGLGQGLSIQCKDTTQEERERVRQILIQRSNCPNSISDLPSPRTKLLLSQRNVMQLLSHSLLCSLYWVPCSSLPHSPTLFPLKQDLF